VDAFRSAGLKPGLYFSMLDLHEGIANGTCTPVKKQFIKNQIKELLTNYGPIPFLVFDGWNAPWGGPNYDELPFDEISAFVKSIQPECLLVNISSEANETHSDVVMFENGAGQFTPDWFARAGINCFQLQKGYWFWKSTMPTGDLNTVDFIVNQRLKPLNAQNQVYIINCAPNPSGELDQNALTRLAEIGKAWTKPADLAAIPASWYPDYDVGKNLAYGKPCRQSSTAYDGHAVRALDGYTDGVFDHASLTHTDMAAYAWWQVDLQASRKIDSLEIWGRMDSDKDRLNDFWVFISANPFPDAETPTADGARNDVWKAHVTGYPNPSKGLNPGGYHGRYVRIQLGGKNYLSLAEVKVMGSADTRLIDARGGGYGIPAGPALSISGGKVRFPDAGSGAHDLKGAATSPGSSCGSWHNAGP
jgi:alpha-L-fucosidase